MGEATSGILSICAYVLLFSAIKAILVGTGALDALAAGASTLTLSNLLSPSFFSAIFSGFLEVTGGCAAALACGGLTALMLTACFCGFGGLSVHCQILAAVSGNGIRTTPFLLSRFFHAVCSCGILYLLLWFFPVSLPVFAISASPLPVAFSVSAPASIAMLLLGVFCLISPKYQQDGSNSGLPFSS